MYKHTCSCYALTNLGLSDQKKNKLAAKVKYTVSAGDTAISLHTQVHWRRRVGTLDQLKPKSLNLAKFSFSVGGGGGLRGVGRGSTLDTIFCKYLSRGTQGILNTKFWQPSLLLYRRYCVEGREGNVFTGVCLSTIGLLAIRSLFGLAMARSVRILLECCLVNLCISVFTEE